MPEYIITIDTEVCYELLKDYHFTVKALYDAGNYKSYENITPNLSRLTVNAENKEDAELIVIEYLNVFNNLEVIHHVGNVILITQALIKHEGQYTNTEAPKNDKALLSLEPLFKLLMIKQENKLDKINVEVTRKDRRNKDFNYYTNFTDETFKAQLLDSMIRTQFEHLKNCANEYTFGISDRLEQISEPGIKIVKELLNQASKTSTKVFKRDLLYTVCVTLLKYLNEWSLLNTENKALTSNQAWIIYETCKIHGLLSGTHEVKVDALNYIRSVINNNIQIEPMNAMIEGDYL